MTQLDAVLKMSYSANIIVEVSMLPKRVKSAVKSEKEILELRKEFDALKREVMNAKYSD